MKTKVSRRFLRVFKIAGAVLGTRSTIAFIFCLNRTERLVEISATRDEKKKGISFPFCTHRIMEK